MQIKNTAQSYGLLSIVLHWVVAVGVISLFSLGLWMDDLDYYDKYYRTAPHLHKSFGVLVIALVVLRFFWRQLNARPPSLSSHKPWEKLLAKITHYVFYAILLLMFVSGYLITTADGRSLDVFNWFSLPSLVSTIPNLEDYAGEVHEVLAFTLITLVILHAGAALKHHIIDKDSTLKRMLKPGE